MSMTPSNVFDKRAQSSSTTSYVQPKQIAIIYELYFAMAAANTKTQTYKIKKNTHTTMNVKKEKKSSTCTCQICRKF